MKLFYLLLSVWFFFSTLLQGILITPIAAYFGLKESDINDTITYTELTLSTLRHSQKSLQPLFNTSFADTGAPQELSLRLMPMITEQEKQLQHWFRAEVGPVGFWHRLMLRCASIEIGYLYQLFDQGLIRAAIFEELKDSVDEQMEAIRHQYKRPVFSLLPKKFSGFFTLAKASLSSSSDKQLEQEYEMAWAKLFSCNYVLDELQRWSDEEKIPATVAKGVAKIWQGWLDSCEVKIAHIEQQHPIVAAGVQRKLLRSYIHTAQSEHLQQYVQQHLISEEDMEHIKTLLKSMEANKL